MEIITVLIMISLCIAIVFLLVFYWSIKSGQFDDTYTPSVRMLFEDKKKERQSQDNPKTKINSQK
jgi:cbb3-type cytochrome oxidase maturation protein